MAFVHGKDTYISLGGNNLSTFTNASEFGRSGDTHNVTCYGKTSHVYKRGLKNATGQMSGIYDNTATTGPRGTIEPLWDVGDPVELIRRPEGTGTGRPQETVDVIIEDYTESNPVADMVTWSCQFQCTDDITTSTQ